MNQLAGEPSGRITPIGELVNTFEFEQMAKRKLSGEIFSAIAGGNRADIERCTFRPHLMVDTTKLNLTTELFGLSMFAPILAGPASDQRRFHPEGEIAMLRGTSAAKAVAVIGIRSSFPLERIAAESKEPFWYQLYAEDQETESRARALQAVNLGCKALVITVRTSRKLDWSSMDRLRKGLTVPVLLKGMLGPADVEVAVSRGIQGIVVSNSGEEQQPSPFAKLPAIVDAVAGKIPVLIDGGFRRGTDILKALILGAQAVLITRPPLWGLAAYGAAGVQSVMEMMQTELARNMVMIGAATPKALNRNMLKIHKR